MVSARVHTMLISTETMAKTGRINEPNTKNSTIPTPNATIGRMELNWFSKVVFVSSMLPVVPPK